MRPYIATSALLMLLLYSLPTFAQESKGITPHPYAGIWVLRDETEPLDAETLQKACLATPSVGHPDGLVMVYERVANFQNVLSRGRFYTTTTISQCSVDADGIEVCLELKEDGKTLAEGDETRFVAKLSRIDENRTKFCDYDEATKAIKPDTCSVLHRCDPGYYNLKFKDFSLQIDIMKRP
ncbi:MAG: hypothetical protein AAF468_07020 [Pseudomonadota bacterium]